MLGERDIGDCLDDPAVTAETTMVGPMTRKDEYLGSSPE